MWLLIMSLWGCVDERDSRTGLCEDLMAGAKRDTCYVEHAVALFRQQGNQAIATILREVSDPVARDFIWLTLTRDVDSSTERWCHRIESEAIAERCRVLVRRPHLHRAIKDDGSRSSEGLEQ